MDTASATWERYYGLIGTGNITDRELCSIFRAAGFADCFTFTTVAERVKRKSCNYYDHHFDPLTASFELRVGVCEGEDELDWSKLNSDIGHYTLMALLKKSLDQHNGRQS